MLSEEGVYTCRAEGVSRQSREAGTLMPTHYPEPLHTALLSRHAIYVVVLMSL